ncbi:hypothetical protein AN478_00270 [Thiohalorhabdus denitrificans]|uniref:Conserved hypothetical integral membrane protein TIGR02206 n=1 Tax=Thiohalorhabdus denitrificans TaxID=381306 RepID=A0A0P9CFS9_9GAMM|nr:TIGR02206 family membrane protein [Thiohalorhabdus denitrificans]KPV41874.1 hypothetical protein AN478_00270 [Thiohalorhabdus denitrificans]SCY65081.1 conserved hypothetical integral membrane protein TIGR02206 [Thiohalorhabdus denitrificans]
MSPADAFIHYGTSHLAALAVVAALALVAAVGPRRWPVLAPSRHGRRLLAGVLILELVGWHGLAALRGAFDPATDLPLHLCDVNQLLLAVYLVRPRARLFDVLYHWVLTSASLALLFPDLATDFPSVAYFSMFSTHGLSLVILCHLAWGLKIRPGARSPATAMAALGLYAVPVAAVNGLVGGNYLYLSELPAVPVPLMGLLPPAPYYWPVGAAFLYLVFRGLLRLAPGRG